MWSARTFFRVVSLRLLLLDLGYALVQSHSYVKVKLDPRLTIQWARRDYGNEASCSNQCIWTDCPGFKLDNQTCYLLESNQSLPIATRSNGTTVFIREEFIRHVESAIVYNDLSMHEFIPSHSPFYGFPLVFPDFPLGLGRIMDFPWGFHLCFPSKKSCYRWYFGTDEWIPMADLNFPHIAVREMIRVNQTWWILGGFWQKPSQHLSSSPHRISEFMDEAGHWHTGPRYLNRYFEGFAAISNTSILAVGGSHLAQKTKSPINAVTEFDVSTGTTTHRFQVTCKMFGTTCSPFESLNGTKMIFCLGGNCPHALPILQTSVFIYKMDTGHWMEMPEWEFPEEIRLANLAWFQSNLYVLGARYRLSDRNTIYKFDESKQPPWIFIGILPNVKMEYTHVSTFTRALVVL